MKLRSVLTVSSFIAVLEAKGKLDKPTADSVRKFVSEMQFKAKGLLPSCPPPLLLCCPRPFNPCSSHFSPHSMLVASLAFHPHCILHGVWFSALLLLSAISNPSTPLLSIPNFRHPSILSHSSAEH